MIYYLPERIYKLVSDDQTYLLLAEELEAIHSKFTTFEEFTNANPDNNTDLNALSRKLDSYFKTKLKDQPNLLEEYKINNGVYSKLEMVAKYYSNDPLYDLENKFYLLSNIINKSYEDGQFTIYLGAYVALYNSISEETEKTLSKYIWLKYMYASIYTTAYSISKPLQINTLAAAVSSIYNYTVDFLNDRDIPSNYTLEAVNDVAHLLLEHFPESSKEVMKFMSECEYLKDREEFQYRDYSTSVVNFMDIKNTIYLENNNVMAFYHNTANICKYLSHALADMPTLLRGLGYYDKCNHNLFALMIRKYLKYIKEVPMLHDLKIENLDYVNKDYILSDRIGTKVAAANPNKITDTFTVKDIDSFFSEDNEPLNKMKAVTVG